MARYLRKAGATVCSEASTLASPGAGGVGRAGGSPWLRVALVCKPAPKRQRLIREGLNSNDTPSEGLSAVRECKVISAPLTQRKTLSAAVRQGSGNYQQTIEGERTGTIVSYTVLFSKPLDSSCEALKALPSKALAVNDSLGDTCQNRPKSPLNALPNLSVIHRLKNPTT